MVIPAATSDVAESNASNVGLLQRSQLQGLSHAIVAVIPP